MTTELSLLERSNNPILQEMGIFLNIVCMRRESMRVMPFTHILAVVPLVNHRIQYNKTLLENDCILRSTRTYILFSQ